MIFQKSVSGPPMGIFDGHIVHFSGGFCQTSFALRTTVKISVTTFFKGDKPRVRGDIGLIISP